MRLLTLTVWDGGPETDLTVPLQDVRFSNIVEPRSERLTYRTYYGKIYKSVSTNRYRYGLTLRFEPVFGNTYLQDDLRTILDAVLDQSKELRFYPTKGDNPLIVTSIDPSITYVNFVAESDSDIEYILSISRMLPSIRVSVNLISDNIYNQPMKFGYVL